MNHPVTFDGRIIAHLSATAMEARSALRAGIAGHWYPKGAALASTCDLCTAPIVPTANTPGYATVDGAKRACFKCCAWLAIIAMQVGTDPGLYAMPDDTVRIWCGTLKLRILSRKEGRHNIAGRKTTYHFEGPDGSTWTGTEYHGPTSGNLLRSVRRLRSKGRTV